MDLQPAERISEDEGQHPEILGDGVDPNADGRNVDGPSHAQSSPPPGLPNLSRCAACYNHKKNFLYGGDGESSSSAGDSGPEVDWDSEPESLSSSSSSSSSSSVEEDEQEKRSSPAASEGGGKDEEREDGGREPEGVAEGTQQTQSQDAPASSILQSRPTSRPRTVVSTLHLRVLPQEHAGDAVCIIQLHEEKTEERDGEPGICHLPPQTGWSHAPSQQHQLSYPQQQHLQAYQMFPQHLPPFLAQGQRSPLTLHSPPVQHGWPQLPYAAQTHLGPQVPQQCWCCYNRVLPPFGYQNQNSNVIMEPSSPKKIQFAVPPLQAQLDPQAAEHIRRRRPTPATLQIYRQPGTDVGEQHAGEDAQPSDASQRNQSSYTQPSMKEIQQGVEQQLLGAGVCEADSQQSPITAQLYATSSLWANHNGPEEPNGNEASLMLANQERGVEASNSSGGKLAGSVPEEEEEEPNQSD